MNPSGFANQRISDMIREADAERMVRRAKGVSRAARAGRVHRVTRSALSFMLWPAKH